MAMIAKMWSRVPVEEQKLILGALAAIVAGGGVHFTPDAKYGVMVSAAGIVTALVRYVTDRLGAVVTTAAPVAVSAPTPPPVPLFPSIASPTTPPTQPPAAQ